jgi:hypothetical protein
MRTAITLEPAVAALVQRSIEETGDSFKDVVNRVIARGLSSEATAFKTAARSMGTPKVDLTHALALASSLEDAATTRVLETGE